MDNKALLQKHNLKATPQRLEIMRILEDGGHVNIDDLYREIRKTFPSVSLSTIYKNMNKMIEKGFLSEVKLNNQKNLYELHKERHSHVVCTECKSIMDIQVNVSDVLHEAQDISHYELNESSLTFHGVCPRCLV